MPESESSIAKFDVKSRVSEKIRETFLELIPQEAFEALVQSEIKAFTEDSVQTDRYYNQTTVQKSPLKKIIEAEIRDIFIEQVKTELQKEEYQQAWGRLGFTPSEFVKEVIRENIAEIVQTQYGQIFQQTLMNIRNSLQSGM